MGSCQIIGPDGTIYELRQGGGSLCAGRGAGVDIHLTGEGVSRRHAAFIWPEGRERPLVRDLDSANGVSVNGSKVLHVQSLSPGATVELGDVELQIRYEGEDSRGAPIVVSESTFHGAPIELGPGRSLGKLLEGLEEQCFTGLVYLTEQRIVLMVEGRVRDARCGKLGGAAALRLLRAAAAGACRLSSMVYLPDRPIDLVPSEL